MIIVLSFNFVNDEACDDDEFPATLSSSPSPASS